jgi:hypothetical protein
MPAKTTLSERPVPGVGQSYDLKGLSMGGESVGGTDPKTVAMKQQRQYLAWVAVRPGSPLTGVCLPMEIAQSAAGVTSFAAYNRDLTKLADTGDIRTSITGGTVPRGQLLPFAAGAATPTSDGVWVSMLALGADATNAKFIIANVGTPFWMFNWSRKVFQYKDSVLAQPATLSLTGFSDYLAWMIGLY